MNISELAEALRNGSISLPEWEAAMRDMIREQYIAALELAKGGRENITQSDWGYLGSLIKKQYDYLGGFARDIAANPNAWMNGRLDARMRLYQESSYTALENLIRREHIEQGYDEERRIRHAQDSCPGCIEQEQKDWQPIGTLDAIGAEECMTNCKCEFEFRRSASNLSAVAP